MRVLEEVLKKAGMVFSDIERVIVCTGPGSFTGIRIGIALLKGLCFEKDVEIVEMTSLENIFEIGLEKEKKYEDKDGEEIFLSVIYANNDQIYMGAYNNSTFGKGRKIIECAGNVEECLEELFKKVNNNYNDLKLNNLKKVIVVYDKDTKQQGKEVIKTIKEVIENKYFGVSVKFKEVVLDNSGFYKRVRDISSGKYVLEDDDIIEEYEIMPNYLKKSQAKRLLENKMKNLKD